MQQPDRRALFEILADIPRPPALARRELEVAACHVETGRISEDQSVRLGGPHMCAFAADGYDELTLELEVRSSIRIAQARAVGHERCGKLGEEEWRLTRRAAHLGDMRCVVSAHAEDASHREAFIRVGDG